MFDSQYPFCGNDSDCNKACGGTLAQLYADEGEEEEEEEEETESGGEGKEGGEKGPDNHRLSENKRSSYEAATASNKKKTPSEQSSYNEAKAEGKTSSSSGSAGASRSSSRGSGEGRGSEKKGGGDDNNDNPYEELNSEEGESGGGSYESTRRGLGQRQGRCNRNSDDDGNGDGVGDDDMETREEEEDQEQEHQQEEQEELEEGCEYGEAEVDISDATVKMLRLLANLSIHPEAGEHLAKRLEAIQMLTDLVACATVARNREELLLNAVAACTNITYYVPKVWSEAISHSHSHGLPSEEHSSSSSSGSHSRTQHTSAPVSVPTHANGSSSSSSSSVVADKAAARLERQLVSLSIHLSRCLFHENDEVVLESARALGNLSRIPGIIHTLVLHRTDEALVILLSHPSTEVVNAVAGVLVNLSADPAGRGSLLATGNAATPLATLLRRSSLKDLPMSTLVCQILFNLLSHEEDIKSSPAFLANVPDTLEGTLRELVECAEELAETASEMAAPRHVFKMAALQTENLNESFARHRDFAAVGRKVINRLAHIRR